MCVPRRFVFIVVAETQNHRITDGRRDFEVTYSNSFAQAQEQVTHEHIQMAFEYLQGRRLHSCSGQPIPVFNHPHSFFLHSEKIPRVSVCAHFLLSCHRSSEIPSLNDSIGILLIAAMFLVMCRVRGGTNSAVGRKKDMGKSVLTLSSYREERSATALS